MSIVSIYNNNKQISIVMMFTVILNILISWNIYNISPEYGVGPNKEIQSVLIGENLSKYGVYSSGELDRDGNLIPNNFKVPVFPLLYALGFSMFDNVGSIYEMLRFINIISNILIIYLVFLIGKIYSKEVGILSAILASVNISWIHVANNYLYPDIFFPLLVLSATYFIFKYIKIETKLSYLAIGSLFLGIASLTKPVSYMLWLPLIIFLSIFLVFYKKIGLIQTIKHLIIFFLIHSFLIGGWMYRNYTIWGVADLTNQVGTVLDFNIGYMYANRMGVRYDTPEGHKIAMEMLQPHFDKCTNENIMVQARCWKKEAIEIIKDNPIEYLQTVVKHMVHLLFFATKPYYLFDADTIKSLESSQALAKFDSASKSLDIKNSIKYYIELLGEEPIFAIVMALLYAFLIILPFISLVGVLILLLRKDIWSTLFLAMVVSYFLFLLSPSSHYRYSLTVHPIMYIFTSIAIIFIINFFKREKEKCPTT